MIKSLGEYRGVAKLGIALGSGPRGRGFESRHSDHKAHRYIFINDGLYILYCGFEKNLQL